MWCPAQVEDGGLTHEHTRKWKSLQELQDRNEQMFYHVLQQNFVEMAPIVCGPRLMLVSVRVKLPAHPYSQPCGQTASAGSMLLPVQAGCTSPHQQPPAALPRLAAAQTRPRWAGPA